MVVIDQPDAQVVNPLLRKRLRIAALFIAILMSGGSLFIPRLPLLLGLIGISWLLRNPSSLIRREYSLIWLLLLGVLIVAVIGSEGSDYVSLAVRYANFIAAITFLSVYVGEKREQLMLDLRPILVLFAVQAILTVIVAFVAPGLFKEYSFGEAGFEIYYKSFGLIFTYHDSVENLIFKRPDGFFWEPGIFQIYMCIFLYISLFFTKNRRDIILSLGALLCLQSTTGLIIGCALVGLAMLNRLKDASFTEKWLVAVFAPLVALPLVFVAINNVTDKITGDQKGSTWARQFDFNTGLNIIERYPIFGIGFDPSRYQREANLLADRTTLLDNADYASRTSSNGIVNLFVTLGIPIALIFVIGVFKQRFFYRRGVFALLLTLSFLSESIMLTPFFLMILLSAVLLSKGRRHVEGGLSQARSKVRTAAVRAAPSGAMQVDGR